MVTSRETLPQQGFSLIQVSVLVAVAGIILASVIPGGESGSTIEKDLITKNKMEKIEEAARNFMAANLRRPCPADGTLAIGNVNFGVEDTTSGRCSNANFYTQATPLTKTGATTTSSSAIATTLSDTTGLFIGMLVTGANIATDTHIASVDNATQVTLDKYPTGASGTLTFTTVAAGVVPTKTLGLPDDYMFDGYGRRIGYVVDIRATDRTTCRNMQVTKTSGAIQIMDSASATNNTDNVMWSLISYGKNGHGAFPMGGSSVANRINSGATNDDEEVNAFVDTSGTFTSTFTQKLIKHEPITTAGSTYFDDLVWTQEATKNTCCTGKTCNLGTRIAGTAGQPLTTEALTGDINGDGIADLILFQRANNTIRVVFGGVTGWSPSGQLSVGTANSSRFVTITNDNPATYQNFLDGDSSYGRSIAVGDLDGNGYDDIAIGYGDGSNSYIKIFYGSASPADTNVSTLTNTITFPATTGSKAPTIAMGNFANTASKDLVALIKTASGTGSSTAYVIYGAASYSLTAEAVTTLAASVGFEINTTSPGRIETLSGVGDVNGDGYDDIIFSNYTNNNMYVMFGESQANWDADKTTAATGSTPDIVNIDALVTAGGTEAVKFTNGTSNNIGQIVRVADINNDGTYGDLLFNNGNNFNVYYGKAAASWASVDLSVASNYNGTNGFVVDVTTTKPAWVSITNAFVGDANNDGKMDMVFTDSVADPNSVSDSGSSFVLLQPTSGWSSIWSSGTVTMFSNSGNVFDASGVPINSDTTKGFRIDGYYSSSKANVQAVSDINNDGKNDLIISTTEEATFSDVGDIYILFGKNLVPWDSLTNLKQLNRY